jgi:LPS-assembly lipoprotein
MSAQARAQAAASQDGRWQRLLRLALLGALVGVLIGGLSGCGFRLRGPIALPAEAEPIYLQANGLIAQALAERLAASAVSVAPSPQEAGVILRILDESQRSRVVAVDRAGKALAYGLVYRVRFEAVDARGEPILAPQGLSLERTFDDNPDVAVLGKRLESTLIYQDLAADAADQVLRRLRAELSTLER